MTLEEEMILESHKNKFWGLFWGSLGSWTFFLLLIGGMAGCPRYKVWQQEMEGKAEIARAKENRQIKIQEALATRESAVFLSQADSIRARGIANANKIINESITDEYVRWLYVDQLDEIDGQIIYIPTEAGIPILEARNK